jgi:hypothetical protein
MGASVKCFNSQPALVTCDKEITETNCERYEATWANR